MSKKTYAGLTRHQMCWRREVLRRLGPAVDKVEPTKLTQMFAEAPLGGTRRTRRLDRERLARASREYDGRAVRRWKRGNGPRPHSVLLQNGWGR